MASLPAIPADVYAKEVATSLTSRKHELSVESEAEEPGNAVETRGQEEPTDRCLFCARDSDGPVANVEHMSKEHGLYLPDVEHLSVPTVIEYLRKVITEYHECLYCGLSKTSTEGVRRHMLDKGHCMINLEREPELLEFWDFSDSDTESPEGRATNVAGDGEYTLPSGKIVGSKTKARDARLARRVVKDETSKKGETKIPNQIAADEASAEPPTNAGTVATRNEGLIGVSDQQLRSLVTVERKMQRQEAVVRASEAWADEKGGRSQKHGKVKMNLRAG